MRQYNLLQAIPMSFYSRSLYRDVAINWGGSAIMYLLLLLILCWIPFTIVFQYTLNKIYSINSAQFIPQIPVLTIKNGVISTPEPRPYIIINPDTKETIAIIDTTGQYKTIEDAKANILVTDTAVISKPKPNKIEIDEIPKNVNMVIDPENINQFLKNYLGYLWIILFPLLFLTSFIYRLLQALLYAVIGKLFALGSHVGLSYSQILRIALVAITPVIVLETILEFFGIIFPYQALFYFLLAMIYLLYGILANKIVTSTESKTTL